MTYKRASFTLMGVLTGLLCFFAILLSTPWGAQLSLYFVGKVSSLQVEYKSGALLDDLVLRKLKIENDSALINASNIRLRLHLRCLWKNQICIDELSIGTLQVNIKEAQPAESSEQLAEQAINSTNFTLPFSVKLKKFSLARAQITTQGLAINLTEFSSALSVNKNVVSNIAINIDNARLLKAHINLSAAKTSSPLQPVTPWPLASLPKMYLPVKLALKSLAVKTLIINELDNTGSEKTLINTTNNVARLSWFKTQLSIEELSSKVAAVGAFLLKGKVDFIPPYLVDLALSSSIDNFELLPQLSHSEQKVSLKGDLADLVTTISNAGELTLTAKMSVDVTNANLPYKLQADVSQFTLPDDIANVITPSTLLLNSEGDLNRHVIDLKSNISGFGYQDAALELQATYSEQTFKIKTLYFEEFKENSRLDITGELQLGNRLLWDVKVNSSGISLPNIDQRLSGRLQGNIYSKGFWQDNEWAFTLTDSMVKGEINKIAFNAGGNVDINHKGQLASSKIKLNYGDIALNIKGHSDTHWYVDGTVNVGDSSLWLKDIESGITANISISGPVEQPEFNLQGELKKFLVVNLASDAIKVEVKYRPLDNHQHEVAFSSARINWNDHTINGVNLSSSGDLNQQKVKLAWLGDSAIDLLINSDYSPVGEEWQVQTDQVKFSLGDDVFKSSQPLNILYNNSLKTLAVNKHCWLGDGAQLCLKDDATLKVAQDELRLAIQLDTDLLTPFIPKDITVRSTLVGNVAVGWQQNKMPTVNAKLLISDGDIKTTKEGELHQLLEWQKGELTLKVDNSSVAGKLAFFAQNSAEIVNLSSTLVFADSRTINSQLNINEFNLSPLQVFLPELTSLEGLLNSRLTVNGDLDKPIITGDITLTKGEAKILGNINTLTDLNMVLKFKGQQAIISGGVNINNALANLKGDVDWQDELQGDFDFDGESLKLSVPPDLSITVSPHLNAQIKASELKILGRIEVLEGKLLVNKLPQGSVSLSKDVIMVNDAGEQVANEKPFELFTNVRVVIADAFKVEGQGFIGRLGGELQVSQQANQPLQLFGSLKIPEGRYRAYGQDLSLTKGIISFNGTANNPYVSMQATRSIEKENIIVGIDATGLANSLNIKLFSKPTMQQSETLSYLVRGRGLDAETSDSNTAIGVALGSALTKFSGVLTQIEKLPLINRIEIDGDDEQASIAGYLGEQVYIKYGVGILKPINELTVRFYLLNRLWVETVSGLENSADIYYSFDIK
jgi:translocation and assembly module TamB